MKGLIYGDRPFPDPGMGNQLRDLNGSIPAMVAFRSGVAIASSGRLRHRPFPDPGMENRLRDVNGSIPAMVAFRSGVAIANDHRPFPDPGMGNQLRDLDLMRLPPVGGYAIAVKKIPECGKISNDASFREVFVIV